MSFLAPLFLLGALAVAGPLIFHLIRRTTRDRTPFSSLMFLRLSPPRLTRRSRIEHWLLLLLRGAVVALLAAAFARPFFPQGTTDDGVTGTGRRIAVLLDTSASLRRGDAWEKARERADAVFASATPADQVALFTFDRQLKEVFTFDEWNGVPAGDRPALARSRLAVLSPGWGGTGLDQALMQVADRLAETSSDGSAGVPRIVLISDFQEGSRTAGLQSYAWPKAVEVRTEPVAPRPASNAGLQLAAGRPDAAPVPKPSVRVRVVNAPDSKLEQFQVGWGRDGAAGIEGEPVEVYVPAGQGRIVTIPAPEASAGVDRIVLRGDEEDFDNTVFVQPPEPVRFTVAQSGASSETDRSEPAYFLRRALQDTSSRSIHWVTADAGGVVGGESAALPDLFVVTGDLAAGQLARIGEQVAKGRILLFVPGDATTAARLDELPGLASLRVEEAPARKYAMLAEIDFQHPLFVPFADARFSDFTKIHFWRHRRFDLSEVSTARVVARFDDDDPAIFEVPLGEGRVVVLASGWHPVDSQFALSTKFVPLLHALLDWSQSPSGMMSEWVVGEALPVPAGAGAGVTVRSPDASEVTLAAGETRYTGAGQPGFYDMSGASSPVRLAVNLDPAESRTGPMPADELERLGVVAVATASATRAKVAREIRLQNTELEGRQKLWRWIIAGALTLLLIETWLAGRTARQTVVPMEVTA
ncbi:MAG: BatA domain-containing protein [Limisphaerales bacterium]